MKKILWLGNFPASNRSVGDHAQVVAVQKWITDFLPEWEVERKDREETVRRLPSLFETVDDNDLVFIHSSGDFGTLDPIWHGVRKKIMTLPCRVVQLPVTVSYYPVSSRGPRLTLEGCARVLAEDKSFLDARRNVLLMAREPVSHRILEANFTCKSMMVPDFAFYLRPNFEYGERSGVLVVIRNDHEAALTSEMKKAMMAKLRARFDVVAKDVQVSQCDLTDSVRGQYIDSVLRHYPHFKAVVTDRMHAMIFATLTNTPCVAIDDRIPHKISGFRELLSSAVEFVSNSDQVPVAVEKVIEREYQHVDLKPFFSNLKEALLGV